MTTEPFSRCMGWPKNHNFRATRQPSGTLLPLVVIICWVTILWVSGWEPGKLALRVQYVLCLGPELRDCPLCHPSANIGAQTWPVQPLFQRACNWLFRAIWVSKSPQTAVFACFLPKNKWAKRCQKCGPRGGLRCIPEMRCPQKWVPSLTFHCQKSDSGIFGGTPKWAAQVVVC